ncbi:DsrE family protein [Haladaptatus pallidirubidus]|uniref:DsrE family protein n=1 Tax=Haladaptatus pallidirubidus TaxID=1008152 RepID=A0AAV3UCI8_9EURY|nr:DsrE family protein [Haladaptatus pallidirubidus]
MQSVIHLISGDESEQKTALAIARNLLDDESGTIDDVAVVAQAGGIEAVTAGGEREEQVQSLMDDGVPFKACSNTLDVMNLDESDLIDGIETVPEGAVEVTRLENEGYAYMRP